MTEDEAESQAETLDILSDPAAMEQIREAERAIEAGDTVSADELRARYLTS